MSTSTVINVGLVLAGQTHLGPDAKILRPGEKSAKGKYGVEEESFEDLRRAVRSTRRSAR